MNWEPEFLEREYNPRVQVPQFAEIFSRWKARSSRARETLRGQIDLRYGTAAGETLDYFPAAAGVEVGVGAGVEGAVGAGPGSGLRSGLGAPLLLFIHGGYWRALDKADFSWVAPPYVAAGIAVAIVNYGLAPTTPVGEIVAQIRRACAWVYSEAAALGVDRRRVHCAGHSAGGHLSAMMLATDWPAVRPGLPARVLAGAGAVSGLFDLVPLTHAEFLRRDLGLNEAGACALSPAFLPLRNAAPLLRAVGALESGEFHRQSRLMAEHWPTSCGTDVLDVADCNHLTVCDAFATPGNVLFEAIRDAVLQPVREN